MQVGFDFMWYHVRDLASAFVRPKPGGKQCVTMCDHDTRQAVKLSMTRKKRSRNEGEGRVPPWILKEYSKDKIDIAASPLCPDFMDGGDGAGDGVTEPVVSLGRKLRRKVSDSLKNSQDAKDAASAKAAGKAKATKAKPQAKSVKKVVKDMMWLEDPVKIVETVVTQIAATRIVSPANKSSDFEAEIAAILFHRSATPSHVRKVCQEVASVALEFCWSDPKADSVIWQGVVRKRWRKLRCDIEKHLKVTFLEKDEEGSNIAHSLFIHV